MRAGQDEFGVLTEAGLRENGLSCRIEELWPDFWARWLFNSAVPFGKRLFHYVPAQFGAQARVAQVEAGDVVWVDGFGLPLDFHKCLIEKRIKKRGAAYAFHMMDDLFSADTTFCRGSTARAVMADLVTVVTPQLEERAREFVPHTKIALFEEPVNVHRFQTDTNVKRNDPFVLWSGKPRNLGKMKMVESVMKRVYAETPFKLRIVGGSQKPGIAFPVPWEWFPYDHAQQAELYAGAVAGLAPLEDTPYNRCKGNYKIKCYMAAGVPPVCSPVGYSTNLVSNGESGFLPNSEDEWVEVLIGLLKNVTMAENIGRAARTYAVEHFSHEALMPVWAEKLKRIFPSL